MNINYIKYCYEQLEKTVNFLSDEDIEILKKMDLKFGMGAASFTNILNSKYLPARADNSLRNNILIARISIMYALIMEMQSAKYYIMRRLFQTNYINTIKSIRDKTFFITYSNIDKFFQHDLDQAYPETISWLNNKIARTTRCQNMEAWKSRKI